MTEQASSNAVNAKKSTSVTKKNFNSQIPVSLVKKVLCQKHTSCSHSLTILSVTSQHLGIDHDLSCNVGLQGRQIKHHRNIHPHPHNPPGKLLAYSPYLNLFHNVITHFLGHAVSGESKNSWKSKACFFFFVCKDENQLIDRKRKVVWNAVTVVLLMFEFYVTSPRLPFTRSQANKIDRKSHFYSRSHKD